MGLPSHMSSPTQLQLKTPQSVCDSAFFQRPKNTRKVAMTDDNQRIPVLAAGRWAQVRSADGAKQFPGGSFARWSPAPFAAHCYAN
jgi:hypothetical protein